jgi:hypothetical protein
MDRQRTEALFAEAQRLRASLIDASTRLSTFTRQLRALLDLADEMDANELNDIEEDRDER